MLAEWTKLTVKSTVVRYFLHGTHNFFLILSLIISYSL